MNVEESVLLALKDVEALLPKLILSVFVLILFFFVGLILNKIFSKVLEIVKIDEMFKPFEKYSGLSFSTFILAITNVVIALAALYTLASTIFPGSIEFVNSILEYLARIISVLFLISVVFVAVSKITEKIAVEQKMKSFMTLISLYIILVLLIDVTNLSQEVKSALSWGLSIGMGISIGVFSFWYFFHDVFGKN